MKRQFLYTAKYISFLAFGLSVLSVIGGVGAGNYKTVLVHGGFALFNFYAFKYWIEQIKKYELKEALKGDQDGRE